jgi:hypothetical protein
MAAPKELTAYPDWFMALANEFEGPERIQSKTYILPDRAAALRLRQQFYGFLRALRAGGQAMYPNFQTVRIAIQANELHIMHVDHFIPQPPEKT